MPDICDLVLDDHETFRRRFAEIDTATDALGERLASLWGPLATLLELHAAAEEELFYPCLLDTGVQAKEETEDAISDHNDIRDAVRRAAGADPGSAPWWSAVRDARSRNSDHMAEEERGAVADLRANTAAARRGEIGARWVQFRERHATTAGVDVSDKDPGRYIEQRT